MGGEVVQLRDSRFTSTEKGDLKNHIQQVPFKEEASAVTEKAPSHCGLTVTR